MTETINFDGIEKVREVFSNSHLAVTAFKKFSGSTLPNVLPAPRYYSDRPLENINYIERFMEKYPIYLVCTKGARKGSIGRLKVNFELYKNKLEAYIKGNYSAYPNCSEIELEIWFDDRKQPLKIKYNYYSSSETVRSWKLFFGDTETKYVFTKNAKDKVEYTQTKNADLFGSYLKPGDMIFGSIGLVSSKKLTLARVDSFTDSGNLRVTTIPLRSSEREENYILQDVSYAIENVFVIDKFADLKKYVMFNMMKRKMQ